LSDFDPFDGLGLGRSASGEPGMPRRRDLREKSTRRSRKAARKRAELQRAALAKNGPQRSAPPARGRTAVGGKPHKPFGKRVATRLFSVVALALAAAFAVTQGGSLLLLSPSSATAASSTTKTTIIHGQKLSVSGADSETPVARDTFAALSSDEYYDMTVTDPTYTVNNSGIIRWPFDTPVPLGDPFGPRAAPCPGCSTFHNGTDFETGDKAPIYAVAAGTVTVSELSGSLGEHIAILHDIKGHIFTSVYGHMTAGSQLVKVGDKITEGELLGLTGNTGESTGPHLDFEINNAAGTPIDSFVWLKKYTKS
jgi:murein DD-endopeptidase MepM/ murein hydrolase activator NlpD